LRVRLREASQVGEGVCFNAGTGQWPPMSTEKFLGPMPPIRPARRLATSRQRPPRTSATTFTQRTPDPPSCTPHGIAEALKSQRLGHQLPGIRGVYAHVTPPMHAPLLRCLQQRWLVGGRGRLPGDGHVAARWRT
jgi:hypothetical protein